MNCLRFPNKKGNHLTSNQHTTSEHLKLKVAAGNSKEITKDAHSTIGDHADGLRNATI